MTTQKSSSCLLLLPLYSIFLIFCIVRVSGKCLGEDESFLLSLKASSTFDSSSSSKLVTWNQSMDCCYWKGVTCEDGRVVGLDLSGERISNGIDDSSSLFGLRYLQRLNLANNSFGSAQIPSRFEELVNLTYLNLSATGFLGQIPIGISRLRNLVVLDVSYKGYRFQPLKLENPNLKRLVENLSELQELHLHQVNISMSGEEWCQALSSSLPKLRVLSLSNCNLRGPIDSSLSNVTSLAYLCLDYNNLSTPIPRFFADFRNLTALSVRDAGLSGIFPEKIFQIPTLQVMDLSGNDRLQGALPKFSQNSYLQRLSLGSTNFSGQLPDSIGALKYLTTIELGFCSFSGLVPKSLSNLTQLTHVDLSDNSFFGSIPSFSNLTQLTLVDLSYNSFFGSIPSFSNLTQLTYVDLSRNRFSGSIPSFSNLTQLTYVDLSDNSFFGSIPSFSNLTQLTLVDLSYNSFFGSIPSFSNLTQLTLVDLSNNSFFGSIPSFSNLTHLSWLDLSRNRFSGSIPSFSLSKDLWFLALSHNNLSGSILSTHWESLWQLRYIQLQNNSLTGTIPSSLFSIPLTTYIFLSHNLFTEIADGFTNQSSSLDYLDLSHNEISGTIPNYLLNLERLYTLDLSCNSLEHLGGLAFRNSFFLGDLNISHNRLQGDLPIFPPNSAFLDYSMNNFNSVIPESVGTCLSRIQFFSLASNNLQGNIPDSICNASIAFELLDLSNNSLSGTIPQCLIMRLTERFHVVHLGMNKLSGIISDAFPTDCGLNTLNLNGNNLSGQIPQSLVNCKYLGVLNLGNNQISGTFPCGLQQISNLSVLILRSNMFRGEIECSGTNDSWPMLQILDVALNNFSGKLQPSFFGSWKAMMVENTQLKLKAQPIQYRVVFYGGYYQDSVTVIGKGNKMKLEKILTTFTTIDFSDNHFQGSIPDTIGDLKSLLMLNFSHNAFTGQIPISFGSLAQLESLDLSSNKLTGKIPDQLSGLTFLSFLNLSYNCLVGLIPKGTQFSTFSAASYAGNKALCGAPLDTKCNNDKIEEASTGTSETNWPIIAAEIGFTVGLGFVIGPLVFWQRWRIWYYERVDRLLLMIFFRQGRQQPNHPRRRPGN